MNSPIFDQLDQQHHGLGSSGDDTTSIAVGYIDVDVEPEPIKRPGEPMRYRRDVPRDDYLGVASEVEHVRAHLAAIASPDDDPREHLAQVDIKVVDHVDGNPSLVSVVGSLNAEPNAPYLREDYDPDSDDDGTRFTRYSEEGQE